MCGPESSLPIITEFFRDIRSIREEQLWRPARQFFGHASVSLLKYCEGRRSALQVLLDVRSSKGLEYM